MSGAENLALPNEQPDEEVEVISLGFGQHETPKELEMEDLFLRKMLSDSNREFVLEQAELLGVHPYQILDSLIESQKYFLSIMDAGGSIIAVDRYKQAHLVEYGTDEQPPAV